MYICPALLERGMATAICHAPCYIYSERRAIVLRARVWGRGTAMHPAISVGNIERARELWSCILPYRVKDRPTPYYFDSWESYCHWPCTLLYVVRGELCSWILPLRVTGRGIALHSAIYRDRERAMALDLSKHSKRRAIAMHSAKYSERIFIALLLPYRLMGRAMTIDLVIYSEERAIDLHPTK